MRTCVITAASNMSEDTFRYLAERVKARFGDDLFVTRVTDESVIGGFSMELDGTVYDMTVRTQLEKLREEGVK